MRRVAVFVDAGYFFAQGSIAITGERKARGGGTLHIKKLLEFLEKFATTITKAELLRIYWYDGTSTGPSSQHIAIAVEANVKMRLGFVNAVGQQKGVDSLIVTDMITLARNRAMSDAVLVSGDEDLRVGVQQAQEFGIRVHLVGICPHPDYPQKYSQSQFLIQEADAAHMWTKKDISLFLSYTEKTDLPKGIVSAAIKKTEPITTAVVTKSVPDIGVTLVEIAKEFAVKIEFELIAGLVGNYESVKRIPPEIDRPLLGRSKTLLGILTTEQKTEVRALFIAALRARLSKPSEPKKKA
jgi:uncharacterized LabA/DUF88 family protein